MTETVIKSITLDNQLISMVEDQGFLDTWSFWIPGMPYHLGITLHLLHFRVAGMRTIFVRQQSM